MANFFGSPGGIKQLQRFAPGQTQGLDQVLQMGLQGLQNPTQGFAPIEAQQRRDFQTKTIPGIAERFTSQGSGLQSSSFRNALGQSATDLDTNLAAMRANYGLANQNNLQGLLRMGLEPQFDYLDQSADPGLGGQLLGGLGQGAASSLPEIIKLFGSGVGSGAGAGLASGLGGLGATLGTGGVAAGGAALGALLYYLYNRSRNNNGGQQ